MTFWDSRGLAKMVGKAGNERCGFRCGGPLPVLSGEGGEDKEDSGIGVRGESELLEPNVEVDV